MRRLVRSLMAVVLPGATMLGLLTGAWGAAPAQAYGTDHVYQLTFSLNCDNRTSPLCAPDAFGLGGAWGWIEPDSDGTADATLTFCGHGQGQNGAFHQNLDGVPWTIVPGEDLNGQFQVGVDPTDQYIIFPDPNLGFIAFPVTPGHYSTTFGPGIRANGTVVKMH
jgi:hypothetical protein